MTRQDDPIVALCGVCFDELFPGGAEVIAIGAVLGACHRCAERIEPSHNSARCMRASKVRRAIGRRVEIERKPDEPGSGRAL